MNPMTAGLTCKSASDFSGLLTSQLRGAYDLGGDWSLAADASAEWASKDTNISAGVTARKTF